MDPDEGLCPPEAWTKSSSCNNTGLVDKNGDLEDRSFSPFNLQNQDWDDASLMDYQARIEQQFTQFNQPLQTLSSVTTSMPNTQTEVLSQLENQTSEIQGPRIQDWDPSCMLSNLSFLEQKIHQLQDLVHLTVGRKGQTVGQADELVVQQQQQLITADLTSIIVQLISTAGSLLPTLKHSLSSSSPVSQLGQFGRLIGSSGGTASGSSEIPQNSIVNKVEDYCKQVGLTGNPVTEHIYAVEDHEMKDEDDADEEEHLPPGSYEILQLEKEEILAPHTHFCTICGKGFKRDANLRMHMRGHGDEYKTPAALAKPNKESSSEPMLIKRYSCPYIGCKRNKDHKKFQPLKTILCVKNHYKRTHCEKSYTCSRCNTKKFSVMADLKTHEKHCGKDKWLCSCGTTFSRKDKLFGHIALFQGHTPAIPVDETRGSSAAPSDRGGQSNDAANKVEQMDFCFKANNTTCDGSDEFRNMMDVKGDVDDPASYFSPLNFDASNLNHAGFQEFPRPPFQDSENAFPYLISGTCDYPPKHTAGQYPGSDDLHQ